MPIRGSLNSWQLPDRWARPELAGPISDLWERTSDSNTEYGGCLILRDGAVAIPEAHRVGGSRNGVSPKRDCYPNAGCAEHSEIYLGFAHTHPWIRGESYPGFGALDFRASLFDGDSFALVCNGHQVFALVRTRDCTSRERVVPATEVDRWMRIYQSRTAPNGEQLTGEALGRAVWDANIILCQDTGYALYVSDDWQDACTFDLCVRPGCGRNGEEMLA